MALDSRIGEMQIPFDGALRQMAEITNLAHSQAMAPSQLQAAALANQQQQQANDLQSQVSPLQVQKLQELNSYRSQLDPLMIETQRLKNQYVPQQMDTSLARVLATLSGQDISQQRFLNSPTQTIKGLRQGLGSGVADALIAKNPNLYSQIATNALQQSAQQQPQPQQQQIGSLMGQQPQNMTPLKQMAYSLIMRHANANQLPIAAQNMQQPQNQQVSFPSQPALTQSGQNSNTPPLETPLEQQAQALKAAAQSRLIKATTTTDAQQRVYAGDRLFKTIEAISPYLNDYASYQGAIGRGKHLVDSTMAMSGQRIPSLENAQQFESLLPALKGEIATVLKTSKTNVGQKEIDKIFDSSKFAGNPQVFLDRFNNIVNLAKNTHLSNQKTLAQSFGQQEVTQNKQNNVPHLNSILSKVR